MCRAWPDLFTAVAVGTGDTVNVGDSTHTMNNFQGDLRIQSLLGQKPTVNVDDSMEAGSQSINMGFGDPGDGYLVTGLLPQTSGHGRMYLLLDPSCPVTINTGPGNDMFHFVNFVGAPALTINGGAGINTLDYSGYTGDITVDLASGNATGLAGFSNFRNVTGSDGNCLIVGDANPNVLIGGTGRNIIIGGAGLDTITGGAGDNLLIGGSTVYDSTNLSALELIMQEWLQPSDFATRMSAIESGTDLLAGTGFKLDSSTIIPDGLQNVINPGPGANWIIP
jgi:Ca2+-binding RTX toxin-like protein